ncbi:hypothetical protein [Rhodococcoides fascians]|uniref:hypothetical protein n=1 Tax=Rhodococcoides fascians TaxID=1828 RepID=UPI0005656D14|nr:hypothetical protein [Rhodococcus fascians]
MSGLDLDAIEARAEATTEGPWCAITSGIPNGDHWYVCSAEGESLAYISADDGINEDQREPDAEFIAHARTDVPALLAALRERDNTITRVRQVLKGAWPEDGAGIDVVAAEAVRAALDPQETK